MADTDTEQKASTISLQEQSSSELFQMIGPAETPGMTTSDSEMASKEEEHTKEDGTSYPSGLQLGLIILALCLSVFLIALE